MADKVTLQLAIQALDSGDVKHAQLLLAGMLKADPRDVRAWVLMAEAQTDPKRRQECLDRALQIDPYNEIARLLLAPEPTAEDAWKHDKAATASSESLEVEWEGTGILTPPESPAPAPKPPTAPIVTVPVQPVRSPEQEAFVKRAKAGKPCLETAMTLYDMGEIAVAIDMLRRVVQRQPHDEMAWVGLIEMIQDHEERTQTAREALKRHPNSAMINKAAGRPTGTIGQLPEDEPTPEQPARKA